MSVELSNPWMKLLIKSDNEVFEVKHLATSPQEANDYMEKHSGTSFIAETTDPKLYIIV